MDTMARSTTWPHFYILLLAALLIITQTQAAPTKDADDTKLILALTRLDDALESLSSYFKETKRFEDLNDDDDEEAIEEPSPELPEKRDGNEDGSRPEFTQEVDGISVKELEEVPGNQDIDDEAMTDEKQEEILRAALRYLLKMQKQERSKKDYDIPFPVFGYKRGEE